MQQNLLPNEDFCCPFKHRIILLPIHQDQYVDTNKPKIHYLARKQGGHQTLYGFYNLRNFSIAQFDYLISESGRKGVWSVFMKILIKSALIVTLFKLIGIVGCVSVLLLLMPTAGSSLNCS